MSNCEVVASGPTEREMELDSKNKSKNRKDKTFLNNEDGNKNKEEKIKTYTKERLLELRSAPGSLNKPPCLEAEFFNKDGVWDPESWFKSNSSRSASPAVDGKIVTVEGKKFDLMDDDIELAPHRRSFRLGCSVQQSSNIDDRDDKHNRIPPRLSDGKSRLTGRAANQRKTLENSYRDRADSRGDRGSRFGDRERHDSERDRNDRFRNQERDDRFGDRDRGRFVERNERDRNDRFIDNRDRNDRFGERQNERDRFNDRDKNDRFNDRRNKEREKNDNFRERSLRDREDREIESGKRDRDTFNRDNDRNSNRDHHQKGGAREKSLPEWMTDGPTSQFDVMELKGHAEFEEEKKARAKKNAKKVTISPEVDIQELEKKKDEAKRPSRPSTPAKEGQLSKKSKDAKEEAKEDTKMDNEITKKVGKDSENNKEGSGQPTNTTRSFDINDFFSGVNYLPSSLFQDDMINGDGIKSKFSQWFQSQVSRSSSRNSNTSNGSRPGSASGFRATSPGMQSPFFAPIQPAPLQQSNATVFNTTHAAAAPSVNSDIISMIRQQQQVKIEKEEHNKKASKEVKGRLTIDDLEPVALKKSIQKERDDGINMPVTTASQTAFELLVQSMKQAGQLPEKPAPVVSDVTGLPEHLLPCAPKSTSPTFEKLKRILSRSPSPSQAAKAVSTVASIISTNPYGVMELERALHGDVKKPAPQPGHVHSTEMFEKRDSVQTGPNKLFDACTPFEEQLSKTGSQFDFFNVSSLEQQQQISSTPRQNPISTAFMPTSVIKKIHHEKVRDKDEDTPPPPQGHPDVSQVHTDHRSNSFPDLLAETVRASQVPLPRTEGPSQYKDMSLSPENMLFENTRMIDGPNNVPIQSAPVTPRNSDPAAMSLPPHSISAPGTPDRRMEGGPPLIQRLTDRPQGMHHMEHSAFAPPLGKGREPQLLAPSAFQAARNPSPVGVIGSGMRANNMRDVEQQMQNMSMQNRSDGFERGMADPRLAPGNGARRNMGADPSLAPGYSGSRAQPNAPGQLSQNQLMLQQQMLDAHRQAQLQHQQRQMQQQQGENHGQQQEQRRIIQEHEAHQKQQMLQRMQMQQHQQRMQQQNHIQQQQSNGPMKPLPTPVGVRPLLPNPQQQHPTSQHPPYSSQSTSQSQPSFNNDPRIPNQQNPPHSSAASIRPNQMSNQRMPPPRPGFQPHGQPQSKSSPSIPLPMQQPGLQALNNLNRMPGVPPHLAAAQALMQQQFATQAVRARMLAQAQLLQQQNPQQVMQAALMAQALARGQMQAQAAMMMNPRAMANNLQIMAEHMGLRPPPPPNQQSNSSQNSKPLPTPMLPSGQNSSSDNDNGSDNCLSKWFGQDVLKQLPRQSNIDPPPSGKVFSLEELEGKQ